MLDELVVVAPDHHVYFVEYGLHHDVALRALLEDAVIGQHVKLKVEGAVGLDMTDLTDILVGSELLPDHKDLPPGQHAHSLRPSVVIVEVFVVCVGLLAMCHEVLSRVEVELAGVTAPPRIEFSCLPIRIELAPTEGDTFALGVKFHHPLELSPFEGLVLENECVELALLMLNKLLGVLIREVARLATVLVLRLTLGLDDVPTVFLRLFS